MEYTEDLIDYDQMENIPVPPEATAKEFFCRWMPNIDHIVTVALYEKYLLYNQTVTMKDIPNGHELKDMCSTVMCLNPAHTSISTKMLVTSARRLKYIPSIFVSPDTDETDCECYRKWCTSCFIDMALKQDLFHNADADRQCAGCKKMIRVSMFKPEYYYCVPRKRQGRNKAAVKQESPPNNNESTTPSNNHHQTTTTAKGSGLKIMKKRKVVDEGI
jgi:hypothetical protein